MTYFWQNPIVSFQENVVWSSRYKKSLPNSAFLLVLPSGERLFPVRDRQGRVSCAHVRNAIARAGVAKITAAQRRSVQKRARALLDRSCPLPR
jgi:hypothetical protein